MTEVIFNVYRAVCTYLLKSKLILEDFASAVTVDNGNSTIAAEPAGNRNVKMEPVWTMFDPGIQPSEKLTMRDNTKSIDKRSAASSFLC